MPCRMRGLLARSPSAAARQGHTWPSRSWGSPCGAGGRDCRLRARRDSAAAFLLRRLGQLFPLDRVPGDDADAAASVEILSFEVTCADS